MPNFVARPDRGRSCASYPGGTAIANPQGIKALRPGSSRIVDLTAALTSSPAAPTDSYAGNGMSSLPAIRLIGIEISDFKSASYPIPSICRKPRKCPLGCVRSTRPQRSSQHDSKHFARNSSDPVGPALRIAFQRLQPIPVARVVFPLSVWRRNRQG